MNERPDHEHVAGQCLVHCHNELTWLRGARKELDDDEMTPELDDALDDYVERRKEAAAHLVGLIDGWRANPPDAEQRAKRLGLTTEGVFRLDQLIKNVDRRLKGDSPLGHIREAINSRYAPPDVSDKELDSNCDEETFEALMNLYRQPA